MNFKRETDRERTTIMRRSIVLTTVIAIVFLLVGSLTLAQRRGPGNFGPGDGSRLVERLNRVLLKAGAEELTDAQASQIAELVQSREVNRPERPPEGTLMQDYGQAILNGDAESAKLIAEDIADEIAARTAERLQSQADFQDGRPTRNLAHRPEEGKYRGRARRAADLRAFRRRGAPRAPGPQDGRVDVLTPSRNR